jgi:hypothetical protein
MALCVRVCVFSPCTQWLPSDNIQCFTTHERLMSLLTSLLHSTAHVLSAQSFPSDLLNSRTPPTFIDPMSFSNLLAASLTKLDLLSSTTLLTCQYFYHKLGISQRTQENEFRRSINKFCLIYYLFYLSYTHLQLLWVQKYCLVTHTFIWSFCNCVVPYHFLGYISYTQLCASDSLAFSISSNQRLSSNSLPIVRFIQGLQTAPPPPPLPQRH